MNGAKVDIQYFNLIGILNVKISGFEDQNLKDMKIFHKCEDGLLICHLKNDKEFLQFSIFISKSMVVNLNFTKIEINLDSREVHIRYNVTKRLLKNENIFDKLGLFTIEDCFTGDLRELWHCLIGVQCLNCNNLIFDETYCKILRNNKLVFNFNYDYIGNLELLSCHEGDMNNIIPNLDEKLKKVINVNNFQMQINHHIINILDALNSNVSLCCSNCKSIIGKIDYSKENKLNFYNYNLSMLNFMSIIENAKINIEKYLRLILYHSILENILYIIFKSDDKKLILTNTSNLIYTTTVNNIPINTKENKITKFHFMIYFKYDIIESQTNSTGCEEKSLTINILSSSFEELLNIISNNSIDNNLIIKLFD